MEMFFFSPSSVFDVCKFVTPLFVIRFISNVKNEFYGILLPLISLKHEFNVSRGGVETLFWCSGECLYFICGTNYSDTYLPNFITVSQVLQKILQNYLSLVLIATRYWNSDKTRFSSFTR